MRIDELVSKLASSDENERQIAAFELGQTQNAHALPHLIAALKDRNIYVQVYAIQGLRDLKSPDSVSALCELINANVDQPLIVSNVCRALGEIRDARAVPTLVKLLSSDEPFTRYDAALTLGEIGDPSAIPALEHLFHDDTMPEREDEDGDYVDTLYSVGEQAKRAVDMINT